ncbi:ABC-2 family transporter protein [Candidatus Gottesmanbacteria bacterium]|nr:ABC-2 family transporter protein [Candidatus Gottesmanbacteria bacterium]
MKTYFQIIKNTWAEMMMYRLNFVLWRVRWVVQRLVVYFLWWAIFANRQEIFGYSQSMILTYVLLGSIVGTFVLGTTTMDIGGVINQGNLSNFLIRPVDFFRYYLARDIGDKLLNVVFAVVEIAILVLLLRPPVFVESNIWYILLSVVAVGIGALLYFFFSLLLGFFGFWSSDVWSPRFLSMVIMEFFAGGLFPLDILPKPLFAFARSLPFFYFIYFPIKVYLGQLSVISVVQGLATGLVWVGGLWYIAVLVWKKGLRVYTAEGK